MKALNRGYWLRKTEFVIDWGNLRIEFCKRVARTPKLDYFSSGSRTSRSFQQVNGLQTRINNKSEENFQMKNAIALIAVAGMATIASAGADFSLSIVAPTEVAEGATFTVDVLGDASVGTHMLGGSFSMSSGSALISNMTWANAAWSSFNTDGGYAGNGNYNAVVFGQIVIPGIPGFDTPHAGSVLGSRIGSFQVTLGAGTGSIEFALNGGSPFSLETITQGVSGSNQSSQGNLSLNGATVRVTPAPSAMALLGLGGLVAGRRRR